MADQENRFGSDAIKRRAEAGPTGSPSGPVLGRDVPIHEHASGLDPIDAWEERQRCEPPRARLRYEVVWSIDMPEGIGNSIGWTDDVGLACWSAGRCGDPGACVYDHVELRYASDPYEPTEHDCVHMAVKRLIQELTVPWTHFSHKALNSEEAWLAEYPLWRPASEPVLAPLRVALYVSGASARAASEHADRAYGSRRLASYPDGRDLEEDWSWRRLAKGADGP